MDLNPAAVVFHPTGQAEAAGQPEDERPEADALDDAEDIQSQSDERPAGGTLQTVVLELGRSGRRLNRQPQ